MSDDMKSPHYRNRRKGVYYKLLRALPKRIRVSIIGRWYWTRVVRGDYSHFHCPPDNQCTYCRDHVEYSKLDRAVYKLRKVMRLD